MYDCIAFSTTSLAGFGVQSSYLCPCSSPLSTTITSTSQYTTVVHIYLRGTVKVVMVMMMVMMVMIEVL